MKLFLIFKLLNNEDKRLTCFFCRGGECDLMFNLNSTFPKGKNFGTYSGKRRWIGIHSECIEEGIKEVL